MGIKDTQLQGSPSGKKGAHPFDAYVAETEKHPFDAHVAEEGPAVAPPARRSPAVDYAAGLVAQGVPRAHIQAMPLAAAKVLGDISERGARAYVADRVIDEVEANLPPGHRGATTPFQRAADKVDFAISVPGAVSVVSRKAGPLVSVARPLIGTLNWMGQKHALARKTPKERQAFVDGLDEIDKARPAFQEIVNAMGRYEQENPGATAEDLKNSFDVTMAGGGLLKQMLRWSSKSGEGERDPYFGNYPMAFETDVYPDGSVRQADPVDMIMRGAFDMTDEEVKEWRPKVATFSRYMGKGFRQSWFGVLSTWRGVWPEPHPVGPDGKPTGERAPNEPFYKIAERTMRELEGGYERAVAAGDTSAGMGFLNMVALIMPDVFLPSRGALELVKTDLGILSRQGEARRQMSKALHTAEALGGHVEDVGRVAGESTGSAAAKLGRDLNDAEVASVAHQISNAVDAAYRHVATTADGPVTHIDTSEAIRLIERDGALKVQTDLDKVFAGAPPPAPLLRDQVKKPSWWFKYQSEVAPEVFPPRLGPVTTEVVDSIKQSGATVLGKIPGGSKAGDFLVRGAEGGRRLFGKDEPLGVVGVDGKIRMPQPTDALGEHSWALTRNITGPRKRAKQNAVIEKTNTAIREFLDGTSGPAEAEQAFRFVEILGAPNPEAATAGSLWLMMEEKINKGLEATPAILDDLSRAEKRHLKASERAAERAYKTRQALEKQGQRIVDLEDAEALQAAARADVDDLGALIAAGRKELAALPKPAMTADQALVEKAEKLTARADAAATMERGIREQLKAAKAAAPASAKKKLAKRISSARSSLKKLNDRLTETMALDEIPKVQARKVRAQKRLADLEAEMKALPPQKAAGFGVAQDLAAAKKLTAKLKEEAKAARAAARPRLVDAHAARRAQLKAEMAARRKTAADVRKGIKAPKATEASLRKRLARAEAAEAKAEKSVNTATRTGGAADAERAVWQAASARVQKARAALDDFIVKGPKKSALDIARERDAVLKAARVKAKGDIVDAVAEATAKVAVQLDVAARAEDAARSQSLGTKMLKAVEMQQARANLVAEIMESMTGSKSVEAAVARAELGRELRVLANRATLMAKNVEFRNAVGDLTLAESRQAERAMRRIAKAGGKNVHPDYAALSPNAKAAVEGLRTFFKEIHDGLKAAGRLGKHTKEEFYERVLVEGFIPHILSKKGRKLLKAHAEGLGGRGVHSTKMDALIKREIATDLHEINQVKRERIAKMYREDEIAQGINAGESEASAIPRIIEQLGLDKEVYFETSPPEVIARYGQDMAAGLGNTMVVQDLIQVFPKGEEFAARARGLTPGSKSMTEADLAAERQGWKRAPAMSLVRSVEPELALWEGWKTYRPEIEILFNAYTPETTDRLFDGLRRLGAPIDASVGSGTRPELRSWVYLPSKVVDELDELAKPSMWTNWPAPIKAVGSAYTSVMKAAFTVLAEAFHVRNWESNIVSSFLSNGWDAIKPSTQIIAHKIKGAPDDAMLDLGWGEMSAKHWRQHFRIEGTIADRVGFTGEGKSTLSEKIKIRQGVKVAAASAGAGAVGGAILGDTPEERIKFALAGAFIGAGIGANTSAHFDVYGRPALKAAAEVGSQALPELGRRVKQASAAGAGAGAVGLGALKLRPQLKAGFSAVVGDAMTTLKKAGAASPAFGLVGALWGRGLGAELMTEAAVVSAATGFAFTTLTDAGLALGAGIGAHIEDMAKLSNAIAEGRKGGGMQAMRHAAVDATFDYQDLTRFERDVLHKAFFFYTWESKNIALQVDLMVNHPKRYNLMLRTMRTLHSDEDAWAMPEYTGYRWLIGVGAGRYIAGLSTPFEAVVETAYKGPRGFGAGLNPLPKAVFESIWGESFFYGKAISEITSGRDYESMPQLFKDSVGYAENITTAKGEVFSGPQIGWYRDDNITLADRLNEPENIGKGPDGFTYKRDLERGTRIHQAFAAHPTKRLITEFNKALNDAFRPGVDPTDPSKKATWWERAIVMSSGFKAIQYDPLTQNDLEVKRIRAHVEAQMLNGIGWNMPVRQKIPAQPRP